MSTRATGTIEIKTSDEKPYEEIDGGSKLTRASVANSCHALAGTVHRSRHVAASQHRL